MKPSSPGVAQELDIATSDGVAHAWIHRAGGGEGRRPGILFYPDAFGVRATMHEMAERLASLGYTVLMPNIFYRAGDYPPFDSSVWSVPEERDRLMALIQSLTPERMEIDSAAYLAALTAQGDVRADRIGVDGYCMGGRLSFLTAAFHGERVRAAASFHGGGLVTDAPNSPHRMASRVTASLY